MKQWLYKIWKSIEESQQKRADYKLLQMLSDRELRDLGIGRAQIYSVIYDKQD